MNQAARVDLSTKRPQMIRNDRVRVAYATSPLHGRELGMRKELKRSLLLWPAAASATITAMSWLNIQLPLAIDSEGMSAAIVAAIEEPLVTLPRVTPLVAAGRISDRHECGTRTVRLPARVANVFGHGDRLPMLIQSQHGKSMDRSDVQIAPADVFAADRRLSPYTLQGLRNRRRSLVPLLRGPAQLENEPGSGLLVSSVSRSLLPRSNRVLAKPIPVTETHRGKDGNESFVTDMPYVKLDLQQTVEKRNSGLSPAGWPLTSALDEQLHLLSMIALRGPSSRSHGQLVSSKVLASSDAGGSIVDWTGEVTRQLRQLRSLPRLGDDRAGAIIDDLARLAEDGLEHAESVSDRDAQVPWLRAAHAIQRRTAVWRPVWEVTRRPEPIWTVTDQPVIIDNTVAALSVTEAVAKIRSELHETGDESAWAEFLLLDEIDALAARAKREDRLFVARRLMSRLSWHKLDELQLQWLNRESVHHLKLAIRPWARGAVDYADLMSQIERQETDAIDLAAMDIADAYQTLRSADNPSATDVADSLDRYYRNANLRMAVSGDMLNRMLPSVKSKSMPLRTVMLGAQVRGTSRVKSDLIVQLSPSPDHWSVLLETHGRVRTDSTGFRGPVALRTSGSSNFVATTPINVVPGGLRVGDPEVKVQGSTRLRNVSTDYDQFPLVGALLRGIASRRYETVAQKSNRIVNARIKSQVTSEINTQLDQRFAAAEQLNERVLVPLDKLQLDPQVIDMQTTDQRLVVRYRLAGDGQLAAFTPRPRAPYGSLASLQVHQSAINNALERLIPGDEEMTIGDVLEHASGAFGQQIAIPDDIPEDIMVQFARTRPVTVEIEDGKLWVTLRIIRLSSGKRLNLTQFIVRAAYMPVANGLHASLVRDGHLRISGPGMSMRERLPLRAIFNKVLSQNRPLPLTLPKLAGHPSMESVLVSQLELLDGWLGIALSEADEHVNNQHETVAKSILQSSEISRQ